MRLGVVSDLHLESSLCHIPCDSIDVLVLAGDTHCDILGVAQFVDTTLGMYPKLQIILVPGNHEHYGKSITETEAHMAELRSDRCHVLLNDAVTIDSVVFVGGTLWARVPKHLVVPLEANQKDFRLIEGLDCERMKKECNKCCDAIYFATEECYMDESKKLVVVTHFAPSLRSLDPKYGGPEIPNNRYYCSELESVILASNASVWVHGHTHSSMDYMFDTTRVVCNPRGYSKTAHTHPENLKFQKPLVVIV